MGFIIGRFEKIQKNIAALGEVGRHNHRDKSYSLCPNIDSDRTYLNEHFEFNGFITSVVDTYDDCLKKLKKKPRKDHIMAFELFFGYSPESEVDVSEFKERVISYMKKKFEGCPFCLDLHLDESNPHIHAIVIPCKLKGDEYKFCGSDYRSKKEQLYQFQDEIFQEIGEPLGLERGVKGSKDKHKEIQDYYAEVTQKQIEEYEKIRQENELLHQQMIDEYNRKFEILQQHTDSLDAEINKYKSEDIQNKLDTFKKMLLEYIDTIEKEIQKSNDEFDISIFRRCLNLLMSLLKKYDLIKYNNQNRDQER